jgi:phosphoglycerate kinase
MVKSTPIKFDSVFKMIRTLESTKNLWSRKTILLRVDWNVPIQNGELKDCTRILETLPTLERLREQQCRLVLLTHLGRPKASQNALEWDLSISSRILQEFIESKLEKSVAFCPFFPSLSEWKIWLRTHDHPIILMENVRFHPGEELNDPQWVQTMAHWGDFYVNDAFSVSHRSQGSIIGLPALKPSCAGLALEKEVQILETTLQEPKGPFVGVIGGSKLSTKIEILENLLTKLDKILVGGAMAHPFLVAQGYCVGRSLITPSDSLLAQRLLQSNPEKFILPVDAVASVRGRNQVVQWAQFPPDGIAFDIGPQTCSLFQKALKRACTILWNGPLGQFEKDEYSHGTQTIASSLVTQTDQGAKTLIGGGDTTYALQKSGISPLSFTHVSTAGGAFLEWLEGKTLPGIQALQTPSQF